MRKEISLLIITCLLLVGWGSASIIPEGAGIIYGKDHVFSLKAPKGWVLDNESAAKSGLHAVFYAEGESWADGKVVAYARSRPLTEKIQSVQDMVDAVISDFHKSGSPGYEGKKVGAIEAESGREGILYHLKGDKWGNFEAVCYFLEKKTINYIVLSSRGEKEFKEALPFFKALCESYIYISDHYDVEIMGKEAPDPEPKKKGDGNE